MWGVLVVRQALVRAAGPHSKDWAQAGSGFRVWGWMWYNLVAPVLVPAVGHKPVRLPLLRAPAHDLDGMPAQLSPLVKIRARLITCVSESIYPLHVFFSYQPHSSGILGQNTMPYDSMSRSAGRRLAPRPGLTVTC